MTLRQRPGPDGEPKVPRGRAWWNVGACLQAMLSNDGRCRSPASRLLQKRKKSSAQQRVGAPEDRCLAVEIARDAGTGEIMGAVVLRAGADADFPEVGRIV